MALGMHLKTKKRKSRDVGELPVMIQPRIRSINVSMLSTYRANKEEIPNEEEISEIKRRSALVNHRNSDMEKPVILPPLSLKGVKSYATHAQNKKRKPTEIDDMSLME